MLRAILDKNGAGDVTSNLAAIEGDGSQSRRNQEARIPTSSGHICATPGSGHSFAPPTITGISIQGTTPIPFIMPFASNVSPTSVRTSIVGNIMGTQAPFMGTAADHGVTSCQTNVVNGTFGVSVYPMVMANGTFAPQYISYNPPFVPPYIPPQYNSYYPPSNMQPLRTEPQWCYPCPRAPEIHLSTQNQYLASP